MKRILPLLFLLPLALVADARAEDWTHWRGPEQTGVSRDRGLPDTFNPATGKNVIWKAPVGGRSTPIIQKGRVYFIAGHGTMGLEIVEDAPDVHTVIAAIGGGGLITGVGSAVKALRPAVRVVGAEPETAAPYAYSLREGGPRKFPDWQASFVDGAGGQSVTDRMWQRMQPVVDGTITVTLDQTREAMRLIAEKSRAIAEGAGALALAAALTGEAGEGPIVCVVSGGNIDLAKFAELVA